MSLEHLVGPENKEVLPPPKKTDKNHINKSTTKGQRSQLKELPVDKLEQSEQQDK